MADSFPIFHITEEMILQDEPMGTKDKYWCQLPQDLGNGRWLFKEPRQQPDNIEHLAEKIACEVAGLIHLPCAKVELAESGNVRGSISLDVRSPGEVLVHGNEIIAGRVSGYDLQQIRHTSDHTFERIQQAIREVCQHHCDEDLTQLAGYLVLDALIGNTDRHHENWALLKRDTGATDHRIAPSFDHASSLGREMKDEARLRRLKGNGVEAYLQKGLGAVYLKERRETAISPLDLIKNLAIKMPNYFSPWLKLVASVTDEQISGIVKKIPDSWISAAQGEFAMALMRASRNQLLKINF